MSLVDYSDLEKEIAEAPELKILPRGTQVKARLIAVRTGISDKNGCTWYQPVFDIPDEPLALEFNDFIWDVLESKEKLDPKQYARNLTRFKQFSECLSIDYSKPFSWADLPNDNLTGWVILGVKKSDEYGDQNTVSKYMVKR